MHKVFQRNNEGYVLFDSCVIKTLQEYKQYNGLNEAGGILLGSYRGPHIEIVFATPPGPCDIRSPSGFVRKCKTHKQEAYKQWKQSNQLITYIGEWHTHPQQTPKPSSTDYTNWHNNLPDQDTVLCIQGTENLWVGENIFGNKKVQTIYKIHVV